MNMQEAAGWLILGFVAGAMLRALFVMREEPALPDRCIACRAWVDQTVGIVRVTESGPTRTYCVDCFVLHYCNREETKGGADE